MVSEPSSSAPSAAMDEGTRTQIRLREMEDNLNGKFAALSHSVDDKLTTVSDSFNNKLESKITEVFEAINLLASTVMASADRSPTTLQGENRQSINFGDWRRTPIANQDLHRTPPQFSQPDMRQRDSSSLDSWRLQLEDSDRRFYQNLAESDRKFYRNLNDLKISFGRSPMMRSCEPVVNQEPEDFKQLSCRTTTTERPKSSSRSLWISPSSTIEALAKVEGPQSVPFLLTTPVSMGSNSAPHSSMLPLRKNDPPMDVRQEQLHHFPIDEGEFEQSVHPFKDNSEGRATHKGELSTFNHQDPNTKVVCESDIENDTTDLSTGFGSSCFTFGVNAHQHKVCKIDNVFEAKGGALKLFDKMPEPVSMLNMFGGDIFGSSSPNGFEKSSVINYIFDPGGLVMNKMKIEVLNGSVNERDDHVTVGDQLKFPRSVGSINDKSARAEIEGSRLQDEPLVVAVFDPGGDYGLLKGGCAIEPLVLPVCYS